MSTDRAQIEEREVVGSAGIQGALWGAAAEDWAEIAEPLHIPHYQAAFDAIGLGPGMHILDAGCGAGLALTLAHKRGTTPTGLDASAGLLAVARERLQKADLRQGDLEALPFADHTFDVVTAFNSVQFASNPTLALREIKRVAKTNAPVAVTTWGAPEQCEMRAVLGAIGSLSYPPAGAGGPFALSAPGALDALIEGGGLRAERAIDVPTPYAYADLETALRGQLSPGPSRRAINIAGEQATRAALVAALKPFRQSDGSIRLQNVFRVVVARA